MSVIKRLVNVASHRVRHLFESDTPHPAEGALDEELAAMPTPVEAEDPTPPRTRTRAKARAVEAEAATEPEVPRPPKTRRL